MTEPLIKELVKVSRDNGKLEVFNVINDLLLKKDDDISDGQCLDMVADYIEKQIKKIAHGE
jgi:hypothetical protein